MRSNAVLHHICRNTESPGAGEASPRQVESQRVRAPSAMRVSTRSQTISGPNARSSGHARRAASTPLGALGRGLVAGAAGTAAMDTLMFARYRKAGGTESPVNWESSANVTSWDAAPAPAQVGRRLVEGLFKVDLAPSRARALNNAMHWVYGVLNGGQYGLVAESLAAPRIRHGLPFGAIVWASSYVILPAAKLYEPMWKYDAKTLSSDLGAHLVYGIVTSATMRLLTIPKACDRAHRV